MNKLLIKTKALNFKFGTFAAFFICWIFILFKNLQLGYSNVPTGDEWDGRVPFNPKNSSLHFLDFFGQSNEHRIVISRLFFYLDYLFFNGEILPLLILGIATALGTSYLVFFAIKQFKGSAQSKLSDSNVLFLAIIVTVLQFSFIQKENFLWAYQSGFFLVIFFSLLSFILLSLFDSRSQSKFLVVATISSLLATASLATGLLVYVLGTIQLLLCRRYRQAILYGSVGLLSAILYFSNYIKPSASASPYQIWSHNFFGAMKYTVIYLGAPIYLAFQQNRVLTVILVSLLLALAFFTFIKIFRERKVHASANFLNYIFGFELAFCLLTAISTAGGRLEMGLSQALSSRYTTISIMGWICALILLFHNFAKLAAKKWVLPLLATVCILGFLPIQLDPIIHPNNTKPIQKTAALSLMLGVQDEKELLSIYPNSPLPVYRNVNLLLRNQQAPFGSKSIFRDLQRVQFPHSKINLPVCLGKIESKDIMESKNWTKIYGWLSASRELRKISSVALFNRKNEIIGYGILGFVRTDVENTYKSLGINTGFEGYVITGQAPTSILGVNHKDAICIMNVSTS